jgi:hypothetical protein
MWGVTSPFELKWTRNCASLILPCLRAVPGQKAFQNTTGKALCTAFWLCSGKVPGPSSPAEPLTQRKKSHAHSVLFTRLSCRTALSAMAQHRSTWALSPKRSLSPHHIQTSRAFLWHSGPIVPHATSPTPYHQRFVLDPQHSAQEHPAGYERSE